MPNEAKKRTLLLLAKGAERLTHHMKTYKLKGIGKNYSFLDGKPVCAIGHIIKRAGLDSIVLDQRHNGSLCDNHVALKRLSIDTFSSGNPGLRNALDDLTDANDNEESRTAEKVIAAVKRFERVLRSLARKL